MSVGNVFSKISNEYYQLTGAERKIADYVMLLQQRTQFLSISEMAVEVGVAEATVSRFCKRLGYKGYNAFKLAVANSTAGSGDRSTNPLAGAVLPEDRVEDMCQKIYHTDCEAMTKTMELICAESIVKAADLLLYADRVVCMGQGGSMILAQEAAHLFSTALPNFTAVEDSHMQAIRAAMLSERDVILYFSYSGSTKDLLDIMKIIQKRGVKVILVTRFMQSPGASYADVVLECGSNEGPLQLGSVAARIAQLYLIDVLFAEVCRRDLERFRARRKRIADALADKHI